MSIPLLTTKLYIPQSRSNLVPRTKMIQRLEGNIQRKLTLISAPAGFGKTTVACEWIAASSVPFSWVSLDVNDNDLGRFLAYIIAALRSINMDLQEDLLGLHQPPQPQQIESLLIPLINQITDSGDRFALVLDDYHLIESQEIHEAITYLIDHQPPNMHLVLLSRADPPLPLARLRARGQMTELREGDLRFSLEEANQFLNQVHELKLSDAEVQALKDRTEGWIAGLHLASITLEDKEDAAEYIHGFAGSHEYIADYLTDEVIQQQPEYIQDFLLKTSVLDRFSSSLCDAITEDLNSYRILKQLREANLFLVPLDDVGQWFRYHRLFMDLLQGRLLESQHQIVPILYLKTSEWFEANGYLDEAIDYAIRGSHFERAARLVEEQAEPILMRSEIATFIRRVEKLPDEAIYERELLCIYFAWALLVRGEEHQTAKHYLDQVRSEDEQFNGQLEAVKSILFVYQRQITEAIEFARQSLDKLPEDDHFFRQIAAWNLSGLLFISGDQEGGAKMLEEVARISLECSNLLVAIVALCRLGSYQMQRGKLSLATELFEQAISVRPDNQTQPLPAACEAMLGLGKVFWERYELDTASKYLHEGIELSKRWREVTDIDSYVTLAHIRQSSDDGDGARQMIERAKKLAIQNTTTDADDRYVDSQGALISLRQGNIQAVERWVAACGLEKYLRETDLDEIQTLGAAVILCYELIIFARFLLARGRFSEALSLLDNLHPSMERLGHQSKIFEIEILMAIAQQADGENQSAISRINAVLTSTEKERYKRVFIDEAPLISNLIEMTISQGFDSRYAKDIFDSLKGNRVELEWREMTEDLVEPLSDREIEVLRMLESELSIPEIAGHLYIAVSTLRTHIRNIYSKLGVHSRFEAVSKARDLSLI